MEEEIKKVKQFENLEGAIKIYKEFRRFKNDGFIESIDPDFFFNLTDYILANSIPISLIEKKREELENVLDIIKTGKDDFSKGQASVLERIIKMFDKELLNERNDTDV